MSVQASARAGGGDEPPMVKGGIPWIGHMLAFASNPFKFVERAAREAGEVAAFRLLGQRIVLLTGDEASEAFYRSSDEQLDQSAAYKLMTPIFGEGLVFDAPIARKNEQLRMLMPALRVEAMRDHSTKIVQEVEDIIAGWGDAGEIELVEFMKQLTINTASHCLLGREFRYELSTEFAHIYHDLEQGVHPLAYHFPNLPIPKFRRRDKARKRLQELVGAIVRKRASQAEKPSDMFQSLIDMRYEDGAKLDENEITGLLVGAIFAGHHTSSGTAAWVLLELLKNPPVLRAARQELDALLGRKGDVTFQSLREMPVLENVLKEVLRLHPPLIILMRQVSEDLHVKGYTIKAGDMVWASPPVTHRMSRLFSNPAAFDPDRFSPERREDRNLMAYQPFGGGKHKCSGNAFAMFQIKAIFAVLLRRYDFELVDAPESYVDNYADMIVQPKSPCRLRYRRRPASSFVSDYGKGEPPPAAGKCPVDHGARARVEMPKITVAVDRGLCQGHAMCMGEAPDHFHVGEDGVLRIVKEAVTEAEMAAVQSAINYCPNAALRLERR
ncbi:cytochrome P450 [Zavarzinia compransoris]|uniref:Cytochrome P450 n=1 Tax=Zavarzinia compransoris TaxID=1264899 RepID=A0A317EA80_9PROT|nr:cytochrome P450 [Zavarzinia compransoris]PWR22203.1 cytochrome P450 [Zavarzinia compransoris]TDP47044.1 sterol 14-demethylase [Zavarzinia compransoris]